MITIRKVKPYEITTLLEIAKGTFVATYGALNEPIFFKQYTDKHFNLEAITSEYNNHYSNFFFVISNNEIVAYFKVNTSTAQTEAVANAMEVERIYVLPQHKGQGIGRSMIEHIITQAQEQSISKIWLGVWDQNPAAIAFYRKMGFEIFGNHSFFMGDDEQTDHMMEFNL